MISDPAPEDRWQGRTGLVHEAILADFPDLGGYQVYACGSAAMVEAAHPAFKAQGLGPDDCFSDAFRSPRAAPEMARLGGAGMKALRFVAQLALYVPLMAILAYFSTEPRSRWSRRTRRWCACRSSTPRSAGGVPRAHAGGAGEARAQHARRARLPARALAAAG